MDPFRWNGKPATQDGKMVWLTAHSGDRHGWPQLTDLEAERLVNFVNNSLADPTKAPGYYCDQCPHAAHLHNPDGSCPCGINCAAERAKK